MVQQIISHQNILTSAAVAAAAADQAHRDEAYSVFYRRPPIKKIVRSNEGPCKLELPTDADLLSEYQVMVRQNIEIFEATERDVRMSVVGQKSSLFVGQVGIRCIHCANAPHRERGAVSFPRKLDLVYQTARNMAVNHIGDFCSHVPSDIKERLRSLREKKEFASGGRRYWANGVETLGVYSTPDGLRRKPEFMVVEERVTESEETSESSNNSSSSDETDEDEQGEGEDSSSSSSGGVIVPGEDERNQQEAQDAPGAAIAVHGITESSSSAPMEGTTGSSSFSAREGTEESSGCSGSGRGGTDSSGSSGRREGMESSGSSGEDA